MNIVKTVDVKGLEHSQREQLIFPTIEELRQGEALRIITEFNPVPLTYMLKARGEVELSYEKEGPPEWILNVKRIVVKNEEIKNNIKRLLTALRENQGSADTKERAKKLLQTVDAKTLGMVEQELIREGVSHEEIRGSLCDIHLDVLKETLVSKRIEVPAPHPIHTFMEEHKVIISNLSELRTLVARLKGEKSFKTMDQELKKLKEVAHHLVEAESHHQREEDVLFPKLEKHDIAEPPQIMKMDHVEFRKRKQELYQIAQNPHDYDFEDFKKKVMALGTYLTQELESHIFKEDNILYQIALQVLTQEEWDEVKNECDKIGYCCFTPEDKQKATGSDQ